MNRFVLFFCRLLVIAGGFFAACIVTATTLLLLTRVVTPEDVRTMGASETLAGFFLGILAVASIIAYAAILPTVFLIVLTEMRRIRGWLFYTAAGGVVAFVYVVLLFMQPQETGGPSVEFVPVTLVAGMLGGLAYWLVAGWRAGGWLPRQIKQQRMERAERERSNVPE